MNRRDTIIIAVLINTGLLAVLFMMASQSVEEESVLAKAEPIEFEEIETKKEEKIEPKVNNTQDEVACRDEFDQVLKQYTVSNQSKPEIAKSETVQLEQKKQEPEKRYVEVTVKRGDYLEKIAKANGTSVSAILAANRLPSAKITIGQVLKIPVDQSTKKEESKKNTAYQSSQEEYYTVKSGDNPWKIAKQFHVKFDHLLNLNNLNEEKARNLKPGAVLRVR